MIVCLKGGLGNQMFQYAFAKALTHFHKTEVVLDASFYNNPKNTHLQEDSRIYANATQPTIRNLEITHFNLSLPIDITFNQKAFFKSHDKLMPLYRIYKNLLPRAYRRHNYRYHYAESQTIQEYFSTLHFPKYAYFDGYFQNLSYFSGISHIIQQEFTLKTPLSQSNQALKKQIESTPNATFVHIRRGDFLASANSDFIKLDKDYYERAFCHLKAIYPQAYLYIFSNDIPWCKEHFSQHNKTESSISTQGLEFSFVENNDEAVAVQEMELMRACQNGIIANSTFSWWAVYLMKNPSKIIISPSHFFINTPPFHSTSLILPKEWITINTNKE